MNNIEEDHNKEIFDNLLELYETNNISNIIFHGTNKAIKTQGERIGSVTTQ